MSKFRPGAMAIILRDILVAESKCTEPQVKAGYLVTVVDLDYQYKDRALVHFEDGQELWVALNNLEAV